MTSRTKATDALTYFCLDKQAFGGELDWQVLPTRIGYRICITTYGCWKTQESDWPFVQDQMLVQMIKLESALKESIQSLKI